MAQELKKITNFYEANTVEITLGGKKRRVNKFEADALKKKLAENKKKSA